MTDKQVVNIDYVAWNTKDAVNWTYAIRTESTSAAALYDETKEKLETLFSFFGSFIVPTEVEYWIGTVPNGSSPEEAVDRNNTTKCVLQSDGVTFDDVVRDIESTSISSDHVPYLSKFDVKDAKTKLFLRDGDVYVDNTTPEYYKMWSRGEVVSENPPHHPAVEISFEHTNRALVDSHYSQIDGETAFGLRTGSYCFIWFEDTPVGLVNRNRLGQFLKEICHSFDCTDARFTSEMTRHPQYDVTRVVSKDLPDEASLIAEAEEYLETINDS